MLNNYWFVIGMPVSTHHGKRSLLLALSGLPLSFVQLPPPVSAHSEHIDLEVMKSVFPVWGKSEPPGPSWPGGGSRYWNVPYWQSASLQLAKGSTLETVAIYAQWPDILFWFLVFTSTTYSFFMASFWLAWFQFFPEVQHYICVRGLCSGLPQATLLFCLQSWHHTSYPKTHSPPWALNGVPYCSDTWN